MSETARSKKLVRLGNAADRLDVADSTVRDWYLKKKFLTFVKVGRAVCVTEESLEKFIASNTQLPEIKESSSGWHCDKRMKEAKGKLR